MAVKIGDIGIFGLFRDLGITKTTLCCRGGSRLRFSGLFVEIG